MFKVLRRTFENDSEHFRDMFTLPPGESVVEGSDAQHPIHVEGTSKFEMLQLLKVLYPTCVPIVVALLPSPKTPTSTQALRGGRQALGRRMGSSPPTRHYVGIQGHPRGRATQPAQTGRPCNESLHVRGWQVSALCRAVAFALHPRPCLT